MDTFKSFVFHRLRSLFKCLRKIIHLFLYSNAIKQNTRYSEGIIIGGTTGVLNSSIALVGLVAVTTQLPPETLERICGKSESMLLASLSLCVLIDTQKGLFSNYVVLVIVLVLLLGNGFAMAALDYLKRREYEALYSREKKREIW